MAMLAERHSPSEALAAQERFQITLNHNIATKVSSGDLLSI
jgi:hypothetical protein